MKSVTGVAVVELAAEETSDVAVADGAEPESVGAISGLYDAG